MQAAFAHEAILAMASDADLQAPGAAVTVALCGHWEHEPPCPLAPHHTAATRLGDAVVGGDVRLRILFAVDPALESVVRDRIDTALRSGRLSVPDGVTVHWRLQSTASIPVAPDEVEHAQRLVSSAIKDGGRPLP
jgi:hypothetical protein